MLTSAGLLARHGVLVRKLQAVEVLAEIDTVIFDKTGTLTEGRPSVTQVVALDGFDRDELLRLAAGIERASEHPLAQAVVRAAEAQGMSIPAVSDFDSPVGKGVVGVVEGRRVDTGVPVSMKRKMRA
eukprot:gene10526-biopygen8851